MGRALKFSSSQRQKFVSFVKQKLKRRKNFRSAHVFDLKLLKGFYLVFGIYCKIHSIREISIAKEKYHKKQFDSVYLVFNS